MSENVEFPDGLMIKPPHEKAPDFVKGAVSIKRKDLGNWLRSKEDDWINLDIKVSKGGKWYFQVNNWKPDASQIQETRQAAQPESAPSQDFDKEFNDSSNIPF